MRQQQALAVWNPQRDLWETNQINLLTGQLDVYLETLDNLGYNASWHGLRASDIGACHHRYRIFLVAVKQDIGVPEWARNIHHPSAVKAGASHILPTPTSRDYKDIWGSAKHRPDDTDTLSRALSKVLPTPDAHMGERGSMEPCIVRERKSCAETERCGRKGIALHGEWGEYAQAINRHEKLVGRPAPTPCKLSKNGLPRLSPQLVEWMMCLPENWVCHQGLSRRQELQALGNGVVPPQAAAGIRRAASSLLDAGL